MSKLMELEQAVALVQDGDSVVMGGNLMHRGPFALVREIARQRKKNLHAIKTAAAYDIDYLCKAGCVAEVSAAFVSYETEFGLAKHFRKAVESGSVKYYEHACYTIISALRAAAYGVGFMPLGSVAGSGITGVNPAFKPVTDPFTGETLMAVRKMNPDVGLVHVTECDQDGNCRIRGAKFEDVIISRAVKKLIVTTEKITDGADYAEHPELTDIPGFLVTAVALAPKGAAPGSCADLYDIDPDAVWAFIKEA